MPDFKGRKDFPEVADNKIKIGDYSGSNRLAVTDIYSPKSEPELRDQMMEPVKGKTNNYDSPVLSQQPVIVLSDMGAEAALMNAIDGYVAKQGDSFSDVEEGFGEPKRKEPREEHPSRRHEKEPAPKRKRNPQRNKAATDFQNADFEKLGPGGVPVPQGALKDTPAGGAAPASPAFGQPRAGDAEDKRAAFQSPAAPSQGSAPKPPSGVLRQPSGEPKWSATIGKPGSAPPGTPGGLPKPPAPRYSAFDQPGGGAGGPQKTTPGPGFDEGPGMGERAAGAGRAAAAAGQAAAGAGARGAGRGFQTTRRGVGGLLSDLGQAAKVGVQQGIRQGKEGAYEQGPEAEARREEQWGKMTKNPLTRAAASVARGSAKMPGVRRAAKALGFGRTGAEERAMERRMEYADDDDLTKEMMLSDILNELESYLTEEQPNNSMVEQQLTKGNISKMMRNTEDKAPRDWKYHV